MTSPKDRGLTYRDAGVDIDAGNELIRRIRPATERTRRPESLSTVGGFAAMTAIPAGYREPVLVTGTDGVGTKLRLAMDAGDHRGVGQDLVAMCVNDVLCTGAEPLVFLDYYATGALDVDVAEEVIKGIAEACELAGCQLAGGETAEMPGFYEGKDYDLAGFCVAVVEKADIIDGRHIQPGHAVIGLASSGAHANGYSLIRRVLADQGGEIDPTNLEALLAPTRIYARGVRQVLARRPVHGMSHITGGGLLENLPRMLPKAEQAHWGFAIDTDAWTWPDVFSWLQQAGNIAHTEMLRTFNCGIGFALCVPERSADDVVEELTRAGEKARVIGSVVDMRNLDSDAPLLIDGKGKATVRGQGPH